ncbi:diaminobutyrate--2-oxoglutarate transaminase [Candidatus Magnetomorum sp. HK-1]|nr:diaminobutyrate--2-oxoglutarate transaminase [Candidatus Magnetomorum sp. HK-1]
MDIFETIESNVRSYCRNYPEKFDKAKNEFIYSIDGREYIDFLSGSGALNYGHNNDFIKNRIIEYLHYDGIIHGLDMFTKVKEEFIEAFTQNVLIKNNLDYKIQFCGPTGTNAVEASLKLARKYTKRQNIIAFMGAFHGMTLGSLSVTSNKEYRSTLNGLNNTIFIPFPDHKISNENVIMYLEKILYDNHSGIDKPAAIIMETVQAEGGINVADIEFLKNIENICKENEIIFICDEIQVGCGRTGNFFSFERAGIKPDLVTVSKSISGFGLPMAILLIKPSLDVWEPGEHKGTFRGNQLAFKAAVASLNYREKENIEKQVFEKELYIKKFLMNLKQYDNSIDIRGIGMIWGIDLSNLNCAKLIQKECFKKDLIIETSGRKGNVLKILPPLNISYDSLQRGLIIIEESIKKVLFN